MGAGLALFFSVAGHRKGNMMNTPIFKAVEPGKYAVTITLPNAPGNQTRRILIKSRSVPNASARGGAYKIDWIAYNGGMNLRETGDTRKEAFEKAFAVVQARYGAVLES